MVLVYCQLEEQSYHNATSLAHARAVVTLRNLTVLVVIAEGTKVPNDRLAEVAVCVDAVRHQQTRCTGP
jgi:hypothetical protein